MIDYQDLELIAKKNLSKYRFKHSLGVVERALEYAEHYNIDKNIVKLVAIAHDLAKELSKEDVDKYLSSKEVILDSIEIQNNNLVHAKIGAYICEKEYGFSSDMANAIKYHTTGRANMSTLEKIIFLADTTEKNRTYKDLDYYVDLSNDNLDKAIYEVTKWSINNLLTKDVLIHPDTISCYNYYNPLNKFKN